MAKALTKKQSQTQYDLLTGLQHSINEIRLLFHYYDSEFTFKWRKRDIAEMIDDELATMKKGIDTAKKIPILPDNEPVLEEIKRKYAFYLKQAKRT